MTAADRLYEQLCMRYVEKGGWPVHVRELLGDWASPSTVHMHLQTLQNKGLVEKGPSDRDGFRPSNVVALA